MFEWLTNLFRKPAPRARLGLQKEDEPLFVRRYDAALTNVRNRQRWAQAHGQSINNDLATDLPTLMARCAYEVANNPMFDGVVKTYANDIVGPSGPLLQIRSANQTFNERVEAAWRNVFAMPDPAGRLRGVDNMKLWVRMLLTAGSFVNVFSNVERPTALTFGWRTIHPRRLGTPPEFVGDPRVAFGQRLDSNGQALEYFIDTSPQTGVFSLTGVEFQTVPAALVQHRYFHKEPEQLTGAPEMVSALTSTADLRDYNGDVSEAARNAAAHAVGLEAKHPELVVDPVDLSGDTIDIPRGSLAVAPAGYGFTGFTATQPSAQYREYVHERYRELGRPIHMPLMMVLLSASDSNFSSAQFEGTIYADGVRDVQSFLAETTLDQLVDQVVTELTLTGVVSRVPYETIWTHNSPATPNIERFAKAMRMFIEDGVLSVAQVSAALGHDYERVVASRQRVNELNEEAGLPPAPTNGGQSTAGETTVEDLESDLARSFART